MSFGDSLRGVGPRRKRQRACAGVVWLAFAISIAHASPAASVSQGEIEKAKKQRAALQAELDKSVAEYEAAETRLIKTRDSLAASKSSLAEAQGRLRRARRRIAARANLTYREGSANVFEFLFKAQTFDDFNRRMKLVGKVSQDDSAHIAEIKRARTKTEAIQQELAHRAREEKRLLSEMTARSRSLGNRFAEASLIEKKLVADRRAEIQLEKQRKAREAAAAAAAKKAPKSAAKPATQVPPVQHKLPYLAPVAVKGGPRCPVDGPTSFTDTYGEPREGGRRHEGVDMFAAQGTPVVAMTEAVVHRQGSTGAGGISVLLRGKNGTDYYYAHLSRFAAISTGQKVAAGERVGYVGTTGNASRTAPHLHFEIHPEGGGPVNPYPATKSACS